MTRLAPSSSSSYTTPHSGSCRCRSLARLSIHPSIRTADASTFQSVSPSRCLLLPPLPPLLPFQLHYSTLLQQQQENIEEERRRLSQDNEEEEEEEAKRRKKKNSTRIFPSSHITTAQSTYLITSQPTILRFLCPVVVASLSFLNFVPLSRVSLKDCGRQRADDDDDGYTIVPLHLLAEMCTRGGRGFHCFHCWGRLRPNDSWATQYTHECSILDKSI